MDKVFIILGPTSAGKTTLSLDLSKKFDGEIISADSRQVYKYMDIGAGKTPAVKGMDVIKGDFVWEIGGIKIWCYDLIKPDKFFSSFDYANFALPKINTILQERKNVFVTGGTGFYIDMLTGRATPSFVEPDFKLREILGNLNTEELVNRLSELDRQVLAEIDLKNPIRLIRAIERLTKKQVNPRGLPYLNGVKFYYVGLTACRELLYSKVDEWVKGIWLAGLVKEVKSLMHMGYGNSPRLAGLVYKSVVSYLKKEMDEATAIQRIKFDLHAYIRRQQTYFKKNTEITWFNISKENFRKNIYNFIESRI